MVSVMMKTKTIENIFLITIKNNILNIEMYFIIKILNIEMYFNISLFLYFDYIFYIIIIILLNEMYFNI
jgi:hypothetical protein